MRKEIRCIYWRSQIHDLWTPSAAVFGRHFLSYWFSAAYLSL